ncbi:MAG: hypothetical protein ACLQVD_06470 [Capsulimonadaceae bacterium]
MKINWNTLAALAVSLLASGQLTPLIPEHYKPIAAAVPVVVPALFPQLLSTSAQPGSSSTGSIPPGAAVA